MTTGAAADAVFAALADPSRRAIVEALSDGAARSMSDLAALFPHMSRQAVAKHVAVVEEAGLVVREKAGRTVFVRIDPDPLGVVSGWVRDREEQWGRRLGALARHLQQRP